MTTVKAVFSFLAQKLFPSGKQMLASFRTLAFQLGQWNSIRARMAVDRNGVPIPWYTYPAIEYLKSFDFKDCEVFEFGSGNSSLYWARQAKSVVSVEDSNVWFEAAGKLGIPNHRLIHRPDESAYVSALPEQARKFDIIVIDGNWRRPCTVEAMKSLKDDGMIILDNSDRLIELDCGNLLRNNNFIQIDFSGFGPINSYCWTTSVFFRSVDAFRKYSRGPAPLGGLAN